MRDALDRVLRVGDAICYPVMNKGVLSLQFSVIIEIRDNNVAVKSWPNQNSAFRKSSIRRTDRVIKVPASQIYMASMTLEDEQSEEFLNLYRLSVSIEA